MLNLPLFRLLEKRFGSGEVKVIYEDQEMRASYKVDPLSPADNIRYKMEIDETGEQYLVRCPFCQDWKQRLYINHRWGCFDDQVNSKNLWMAHCWNENCLNNYQNQLSLYDQVITYHQIGPVDVFSSLPKRTASGTKRKPRKIELPSIWPLDHMKTRCPQHDAIQYVEDRLWDPVYLGKRYDVGFCVDSYYEQARNRLVAPIKMEGKLIGWQARFLGTPEKGVAKWYTCPGMHVGSALYNYDGMCPHQTKVVVEGPADVWSFGPQACGIFNKNMTSDQRKLFAKCFSPGDVAVILLDPEQDDKAKARREQHHIEKLYSELNREPKLAGRVIKVYLPDGCDPDELDREYMRAIIRHEASKCGLAVSFGKPTEKVNEDSYATV